MSLRALRDRALDWACREVLPWAVFALMFTVLPVLLFAIALIFATSVVELLP